MSGSITRRAFFGAALAGIAACLTDCSGNSSKPSPERFGLEEKVEEEKVQIKETTKNKIIELNWANYESALDSGKPVFIEFYSDTCPPCRAIEPAYKEVALKSDPDDVLFTRCKCHTKLEPPLVGDWGLCGVPKIVLAQDNGLMRVIPRLSFMRGEGGAARFQMEVKSMIRQVEEDLGRYCSRGGNLKQALPGQLTELPPDDYKRIVYSGVPVIVEVYSESSSSKEIAPAVRKASELYAPEQVLFTRCEFTLRPNHLLNHPLLSEWDINGVPRVILAYKGGLKKVICGDELLPLKGENGAAALQQMVEKGLEKYCGDCGYLKRESTK